MAESSQPKNKRHGTLTFYDNADVNDYEVSIEAGDLSLTIAKETKAVVLDRGKFLTTPAVLQVDDQPVGFTFTAVLRNFTDATTETLGDILNWSGYVAANWVPRNGVLAENYRRPLVKLVYDVEGTSVGDATDHACTLDFADIESWGMTEGEMTTLSITGTAYVVKPTLTAA